MKRVIAYRVYCKNCREYRLVKNRPQKVQALELVCPHCDRIHLFEDVPGGIEGKTTTCSCRNGEGGDLTKLVVKDDKLQNTHIGPSLPKEPPPGREEQRFTE